MVWRAFLTGEATASFPDFLATVQAHAAVVVGLEFSRPEVGAVPDKASIPSRAGHPERPAACPAGHGKLHRSLGVGQRFPNTRPVLVQGEQAPPSLR